MPKRSFTNPQGENNPRDDHGRDADRAERHVSCPMDSSWRRWALGTPVTGRLNPADQKRVMRARRVALATNPGTLNVTWEIAADDVTLTPVDPATEVNLRPGSPRHIHTTLSIQGHAVHVDRIATQRENPTFAFREYRIFVDRVLAGRGGLQACGLGAAITDLPAVALLGHQYAIVVTENDEYEPVVKLRTVRANERRVRKARTGPLVVATGILSLGEFSELTPAEQDYVEGETQKMATRHGEEYLRRNRKGFRADLTVIL
jgi:hypothetical protein